MVLLLSVVVAVLSVDGVVAVSVEGVVVVVVAVPHVTVMVYFETDL